MKVLSRIAHPPGPSAPIEKHNGEHWDPDQQMCPPWPSHQWLTEPREPWEMGKLRSLNHHFENDHAGTMRLYILVYSQNIQNNPNISWYMSAAYFYIPMLYLKIWYWKHAHKILSTFTFSNI